MEKMMKYAMILTAVFCCALLSASPYGRALKQARRVAAPGGTDEFRQIWIQLEDVIRQNRGHLPGPAGAAGLRKLCGPGKVSPALLKINDFKRLTEKNCAWAYVGGELGVLRGLPRDGGFPVLFTKPAPGVRQISVLLADGRAKRLDARTLKSASSVVKALKRESRHPNHPAWKKLIFAAGQIDRSTR